MFSDLRWLSCVCVHACMHLFRCACLRVHLMSSCLIHRENVIARCVFPRSRSDICSRLIGSDCFILHHIQVSLRTLTWQKHTSQQHSACVLIHAFYFKGVHIFKFTCLLFSSSCAWRNSSSISLNRPTSSQFCRNRVGVGVWSGRITYKDTQTHTEKEEDMFQTQTGLFAF